MSVKKNRGFTLIEVVTVVVMVFALFILLFGAVITGIGKGNFWFSESSVLRELQVNHPEVTRVLKTERNVYSDSVITIENKDGSRSDYCLDSDILWNYSFSACQK